MFSSPERRLSALLFILCMVVGFIWSALDRQSDRLDTDQAVVAYEQLFWTQLNTGARDAAADTIKRCLDQFPGESRCKKLVAELRRAATKPD